VSKFKHFDVALSELQISARYYKITAIVPSQGHSTSPILVPMETQCATAY